MISATVILLLSESDDYIIQKFTYILLEQNLKLSHSAKIFAIRKIEIQLFNRIIVAKP